MSIFYIINGIIVLIFIVVLMTGVVRVRRHPERYGPRQGGLGRPNQSRAKGLARAILETIPIVKFGESYDRDADKVSRRDIELVNAGETDRRQSTNSHNNNHPTVPVTAAGGLSAIGSDIQAGSDGLECSICTEDFVKSEDIRVLPCNHRFHPVCIDPWLLNMSGTCPLCRIDLRPSRNTSDTTANSAGDSLPEPLTDETNDTAAYGSHIPSPNDLQRAWRSGLKKSIAALRRL